MSIFRKTLKVDFTSESEIFRRRKIAIEIIEKYLGIPNITRIFMDNHERLDKLILCFKAAEDEASIRFIQSHLYINDGKTIPVEKIKEVSKKLKEVV